jgi:OmpA-OmpF porin, OOP family
MEETIMTYSAHKPRGLVPAGFAMGLALCVYMIPAPAGHAADAPTTDQIINSLSPRAGGPIVTRGIRLGGQPPVVAPAPVRRTHSTTGTAPNSAAASATNSNSGLPETSLTVPFATGSADLSPGAERVLSHLGEALSSPRLAGYRFRVEGHTDTVGSRETNKILSQERAETVLNYLVNNYKIDRSRLMPVGVGEDDLLVQTGQDVPSAANRRVVVVNLGH